MKKKKGKKEMSKIVVTEFTNKGSGVLDYHIWRKKRMKRFTSIEFNDVMREIVAFLALSEAFEVVIVDEHR